ncbi:UMTA methyltransferase family protein [Metarhizium acridum CQMa 102]|uniref:UMTA methyltransferase family protein n=1 Tax=Metarhizium acridum (strain CQMa 102) TaxID=655827 RepID=E9EGY6_METAQ|nr:UMTA methyltransferase family protein [Metarhizium acridum CQMa 102]EFY84812.1 UMTA methyltransferase family protein [Metarhizium acridum CQMa 102]
MNRPHSFDDITSDYDESFGVSEFTSIHTAHLIYSYEHGRRYQGLVQNRYGMPNDEAEQMREGIKHKLYTDYILDGKQFLAPVPDNPQKIVDLGTGAGYWALDGIRRHQTLFSHPIADITVLTVHRTVAEKFPSARVIGTDLSPIQPQWAPPNTEFRVEDLDDEHRPWSSIYTGADAIHTRALLPTLRNPKLVLRRAFENLKPGGWVECHEIVSSVFSEDGAVNRGHPLHKMYDLINGSFSEVYGWNLHIAAQIPDVLREIGFVSITQRQNKIPLGRWHHDARMR